MTKGRIKSGLLLRITMGEGLARGDCPCFDRRRGLHCFGAAARTAGPWQADLNFGACCDCGFQPTTIFFHAYNPLVLLLPWTEYRGALRQGFGSFAGGLRKPLRLCAAVEATEFA